MLDPSVAIAVRGIGRREHGLRECGEAEDAEEAEGLCGIIPGMRAVCSTKRGPRCSPHSRIGQQQQHAHRTRVERGGGDKGLKTGQRETKWMQNNHLILSLPVKRRVRHRTTPDGRVSVVDIFDHYSTPHLHGEKKKYGKWKSLQAPGTSSCATSRDLHAPRARRFSPSDRCGVLMCQEAGTEVLLR